MTLCQILRELQIALAVILGACPVCRQPVTPGRLAAFQLVSLAGQQAIVQIPVTRQRGPRSAGQWSPCWIPAIAGGAPPCRRPHPGHAAAKAPRVTLTG
jgi:hypothetical protein